MRCFLCNLNDGEEEWHKVCTECKEKHNVDTYSRPLMNVAYHLIVLWEKLMLARKEDALTEEELELIRKESVKWVDIQRKINGQP